jgi:hypothetical protein
MPFTDFHLSFKICLDLLVGVTIFIGDDGPAASIFACIRMLCVHVATREDEAVDASELDPTQFPPIDIQKSTWFDSQCA